jgi:hypothetical protein
MADVLYHVGILVAFFDGVATGSTSRYLQDFPPLSRAWADLKGLCKTRPERDAYVWTFPIEQRLQQACQDFGVLKAQPNLALGRSRIQKRHLTTEPSLYKGYFGATLPRIQPVIVRKVTFRTPQIACVQPFFRIDVYSRSGCIRENQTTSYSRFRSIDTPRQ